jgi:NitT/TauT family transport system ATP-binding protein
VPFDLPRPRQAESTADPLFVQVKAHTLAVFKREMKA